jgi:hypothetical protein
MSKKPKTGTCIYCGSVGIVTDDHIPPQGIYGKPLPDGLLKVPTCQRCNNSFSKDDEYFRQKLAMSFECYNHPTNKTNVERILRSLQQPEANGMATAFFRDIRSATLTTKSGIFIENTATCSVDLDRMASVVARIASGLTFCETGIILPVDYDIKILCNEFLEQEELAIVQKVIETIIKPLLKRPRPSLLTMFSDIDA